MSCRGLGGAELDAMNAQNWDGRVNKSSAVVLSLQTS